MTDTPAPLPWAVKHHYGFEAVQITMVSKSRVYYFSKTPNGKEQFLFCSSSRILPWRGDESGAKKLVEQLKSAKAECARRRVKAEEWLDARIKELTQATGGA